MYQHRNVTFKAGVGRHDLVFWANAFKNNRDRSLRSFQLIDVAIALILCARDLSVLCSQAEVVVNRVDDGEKCTERRPATLEVEARNYQVRIVHQVQNIEGSDFRGP